MPLAAWAMLGLGITASAQSFEECQFRFDVNTVASDWQSVMFGVEQRGGLWRLIAEAPPDVQVMGRFVGRLDVCQRNPGPAKTFIADDGQAVTIPTDWAASQTWTRAW